MRAAHIDAASTLVRRMKEIDIILSGLPDSGGFRMKSSSAWVAFSDDAMQQAWIVMRNQLQAERAALCRRAAQINLRLDG